MPHEHVAAVPDAAGLEEIRKRLGILSIRMTTKAASGHPSSCLSASHLVTALFFGGYMRYDAGQPDWPERDRFVLSKGHAAPILYAALKEAGFIDNDLMSLREIGSPLEGHPNVRRLPGVEASTGSLGQGLSLALGMALGQRMDGSGARTFVVMGDGEVDEGQVWEAAMAAAKYDVDNLVALVDRNGYQQMGEADKVLPLDSLVEKFAAFGWRASEIDGHDWSQVLGALDAARETDGRPTVIIAHTKKGYGVSQILADPGNKYHGVPLSEEEMAVAIEEIENA